MMLRDALHSLRVDRNSTLTVFAMLSLTFGIGTATYSVVDGVAFRPLPYSAPSQLIAVSIANAVSQRGVHRPSPSQYFVWKESGQSLAGLAAARLTAPRRLDHDSISELIIALEVTHDLFGVLGAPANISSGKNRVNHSLGTASNICKTLLAHRWAFF